jgi:hypothetical protein
MTNTKYNKKEDKGYIKVICIKKGNEDPIFLIPIKEEGSPLVYMVGFPEGSIYDEENKGHKTEKSNLCKKIADTDTKKA